MITKSQGIVFHVPFLALLLVQGHESSHEFTSASTNAATSTTEDVVPEGLTQAMKVPPSPQLKQSAALKAEGWHWASTKQVVEAEQRTEKVRLSSHRARQEHRERRTHIKMRYSEEGAVTQRAKEMRGGAMVMKETPENEGTEAKEERQKQRKQETEGEQQKEGSQQTESTQQKEGKREEQGKEQKEGKRQKEGKQEEQGKEHRDGQQQKQGKEEKQGQQKEEKEEKEDYYHVNKKQLWAFVVLTALLILGTVGFEILKNWVYAWVRSTPMQQLVSNLFGELTVLGFLGIVTFMMGQVGLGSLSSFIFTSMEKEEAKDMLGEMLEAIHLVIFFIMLIFICQAIGLVVEMFIDQQNWFAMETQCLTPVGRRNVVANYKKSRERCSPLDWVCSVVGCGNRRYAWTCLKFMLLRTDFIHFQEARRPKSGEGALGKRQIEVSVVDGDGECNDHEMLHPRYDTTRLDNKALAEQHLKSQFPFHTYLMKVTGEHLAEVVEIGTAQWLLVIVLVVIVAALTTAAGYAWDFLLNLWVVLGWLILAHVMWFHHYLVNCLEQLSPTCQGSTLEDESMQSKSWIGSQTKYLAEGQDTPRPHLQRMPEFLVGKPADPSIVGAQKMYNIFLFGRNEATFQIRQIRAAFMSCSIYIAVLVSCIDDYIGNTSNLTRVISLTVTALIPVAIVLFFYMSEVIFLSSLVTSVEHMRHRRILDEVNRLTKENNTVSLMRRIAVILSGGLEPLTTDEVECMAAAMRSDQEDKEATEVNKTRSRVVTSMMKESQSGLVKYIEDYLQDPSAQLVMLQINATFESIDKDNSGYLDHEEVYAIFKKIGIEDREQVDNFMQKSLVNIDRQMSSKQLQSKQQRSWCGPTQTTAPVSTGGLSKEVFLAWFLSLEKAARSLSAAEIADVWFNLIDVDSSGSITVDECKEVLDGTGFSFSSDELSQLVLELDTNGDGLFEKDEFQVWFENHLD